MAMSTDTGRSRAKTIALAVVVGIVLGLAFLAFDLLIDSALLGEQPAWPSFTEPLDLLVLFVGFAAAIAFSIIYASLLIANRKTEASERRYRILAEASRDNIFVIGRDAVIEYVNSFAAGNFGVPPEDLIGKRYTEVFAAPALERMGEMVRHAFSGSEVYAEEEIPFPRGSVWLGTKLVPLRTGGGEVTAVMGVARDIRARKRAADLSATLNGINEVVHSKHGFDDIMKAVVSEAAQGIGADSGMVLTCAADSWTIGYAHGVGQSVVGTRLSPGEARVSEIAARTREPVSVDDTLNDPRVDRSTVERFGTRSLLAIPLVTRRGVTGVMLFGRHAASAPFPQDEVEFAKRVGTTVSLALENARLYEAQREVATALQAAILVLPEELPGIGFGLLYRAASETSEVGGDFYDLFQLGDDAIGITIGDVSGKGIDAATLTSLVKNTVKAYAYEGISPASVMTRTNQVVAAAVREDAFVTAFFAVLDPASGSLAYCNAGHPPAALRRRDGLVEQLPAHSPIVGAFPGSSYADDRVRLSAEDVLVLYTDGATEARRDKAFYGEDRLFEAVGRLGGTPVEKVPEALYEDVLRFTGGKLSDDLALLAVSLRDGDGRG